MRLMIFVSSAAEVHRHSDLYERNEKYRKVSDNQGWLWMESYFFSTIHRASVPQLELKDVSPQPINN